MRETVRIIIFQFKLLTFETIFRFKLFNRLTDTSRLSSPWVGGSDASSQLAPRPHLEQQQRHVIPHPVVVVPVECEGRVFDINFL